MYAFIFPKESLYKGLTPYVFIFSLPFLDFFFFLLASNQSSLTPPFSITFTPD